jgi:hypothetical protein
MPSVTLTKTVTTSPKESKSNNSMQSEKTDSSLPSGWSHKHPNISESFYKNLTPPTDLEDAHIMMCCHQQSVDDFQMQIDMIDIEISMLCEDGKDLPPYQESRLDELEERKLKLLSGKRFHQNARHAYWYVTARGDK